MPKKPPPESPLYVRLPSNAIDKLHRASEALGIHKKDLVAGLVTKYVDPDSPTGLKSLAVTTVGQYSFQSYEPPEIMNAEQAGQFLQIDERNVIELADAGKIPGKRLGPVWRFSREALVAWLSTPDTSEKKR